MKKVKKVLEVICIILKAIWKSEMSVKTLSVIIIIPLCLYNLVKPTYKEGYLKGYAACSNEYYAKVKRLGERVDSLYNSVEYDTIFVYDKPDGKIIDTLYN